MHLVTILVFVWAFRLAIYLGVRKKSEDYRYKNWRESWEADGDCNYYMKSFFIVFMLQSIFSLIVNLSALFVNIFSQDNDIEWTDFTGAALWLIGLLIESIADAQLARHLSSPEPGSGKFIKTGLWRYSRHPNYFGEALIWWGIFIIACGLEYGWITVISPLTITLLLRFVSGVPFPEEKYKDNAEWQQYCRETNVFVPWFATPEET